MIVGFLTTCHTQYTWDSSICIFLFNITILQVFVTYLTGALYVHLLWFYRHRHNNRVRSKLFVTCQRWWFQWRFWFVPLVPGYLREEEEHKPDPRRNPIERNHMGLHIKNEYNKLLKPRQSFRITLYYFLRKYRQSCLSLYTMMACRKIRCKPSLVLNLLTPNVNYSVRTAPLTSKVAFYIFAQQIQVLNILNVVYTLRFFLFKMQFVS